MAAAADRPSTTAPNSVQMDELDQVLQPPMQPPMRAPEPRPLQPVFLDAQNDPGNIAPPVSAIDSREQELSRPPVIVDRYRPLLPFRLSKAEQNTTTELIPVRNRRNDRVSYRQRNGTTYRTIAGDTLQTISTDHYGQPDHYLDIYQANQDVLTSPLHVPADIELLIPEIR